MKKCMVLLIVMGVFCSFSYAQDDCDSEYAKMIDMLTLQLHKKVLKWQ